MTMPRTRHLGPWTLAELLAFADRSGGPASCWPWTRARFVAGYGKVRVQYGYRLTHRLVFELAHGYRPECVLHSCDNPPCINPAHLLGGTLADNARDMWAKGRARGITVLNRHKTHCPRGHEYSADNTRRTASGGRACRECPHERVA